MVAVERATIIMISITTASIHHRHIANGTTLDRIPTHTNIANMALLANIIILVLQAIVAISHMEIQSTCNFKLQI